MGVRTTEQVKLSVEHADVAVMCLGLDATIEGEQGDARNEYASGDKLGLNLPGLQEELLETVAAMGKPEVVRQLPKCCLENFPPPGNCR